MLDPRGGASGRRGSRLRPPNCKNALAAAASQRYNPPCRSVNPHSLAKHHDATAPRGLPRLPGESRPRRPGQEREEGPGPEGTRPRRPRMTGCAAVGGVECQPGRSPGSRGRGRGGNPEGTGVQKTLGREAVGRGVFVLALGAPGFPFPRRLRIYPHVFGKTRDIKRQAPQCRTCGNPVPSNS